jgi:hypothetical protein
MTDQPQAVAFDLDAASLASLRTALPDWEIETLHRATAGSLTHDWNAAEADLLVVAARGEEAETLRLCRFLVRCSASPMDPWQSAAPAVAVQAGRNAPSRRADAPLLVLVPPGLEPVVRAAYEAGADHCLVLPVQALEVASAVARLRQGDRSKRHALMFGLGQIRSENCWRDPGTGADSAELIGAALEK